MSPLTISIPISLHRNECSNSADRGLTGSCDTTPAADPRLIVSVPTSSACGGGTTACGGGTTDSGGCTPDSGVGTTACIGAAMATAR